MAVHVKQREREIFFLYSSSCWQQLVFFYVSGVASTREKEAVLKKKYSCQKSPVTYFLYHHIFCFRVSWSPFAFLLLKLSVARRCVGKDKKRGDLDKKYVGEARKPPTDLPRLPRYFNDRLRTCQGTALKNGKRIKIGQRSALHLIPPILYTYDSNIRDQIRWHSIFVLPVNLRLFYEVEFNKQKSCTLTLVVFVIFL